MTIIALPIMSIYVFISQIFIIYLYFCTHYKYGQNACMLTARLACSQFYILRFGKISQCRLEQQRNTNSHNHTFIYLEQVKKQSVSIVQNKVIQKYLHRSLFTFLEIKPPMQFTAMIFTYDFVNFTV